MRDIINARAMIRALETELKVTKDVLQHVELRLMSSVNSPRLGAAMPSAREGEKDGPSHTL